LHFSQLIGGNALASFFMTCKTTFFVLFPGPARARLVAADFFCRELIWQGCLTPRLLVGLHQRIKLCTADAMFLANSIGIDTLYKIQDGLQRIGQ
ncbi:MAG: hypothetical protein RBS57_16740, partial [Desulforhabdus sp.]|nr:hypothetical protein [Desulforhabdus sp.]